MEGDIIVEKDYYEILLHQNASEDEIKKHEN